MLTAINGSMITMAISAQKTDAPFYCPECRKEVTLKKGTVITHHFAHKSPVTCLYGSGETEAHRRAKTEIYDSLIYTGQAENVEIEKSFGDVRSDIYAVINDVPVAIEIQRSTLTPESIMRRTVSYANKGIYVLWLALNDGRIENYRFIPKWWEKWLHAAYFGKVFYWMEREYVTPVKFEPAYSYVEYSDWSGGYTKTLKRYKTPVAEDYLSITEDFGPKLAREWSGGKFTIPDRMIFTALD